MEKRRILCVFIFFFFFCIFFLILRTAWTLSHTLTPDFSVYYQAAENIRGSVSVYTGKTAFTLFAYPLISGLFFIPFTFLPYHISQTIFLFLNFFVLALISLITVKLLLGKRSLLLSGLLFAFAYLSFPTKFSLGMGQVNLVAYLLLLLSFYFYVQRINLIHKVDPYITIAFFFTIACILKPILGFMLIFFILQKQWRILFYTFLFVLVTFLLGAFIDHHAIADYMYYIQHIIPEVSRPVGKEIYYNQGFMSFIFREIPNQMLRLVLSYIGMAVIFLSGITAFFKQKNQLYRLSVLLTMLPLLDSMSWQHHFIVLIFPFSFAAYTFWKERKWYLFVLTTIAYVLVSSNIAHPEIFMHFPQNTLLSNTFYGALLLFVVLILNGEAFQKQKQAAMHSFFWEKK